MIRWGFCSGAQALPGSDNVASVIKRVCPRLVPVIFPEFTSSSILMLTNS